MASVTDFGREQELFKRCLDHPRSEWERILETHCDDTALRERVRRLLQHHREEPTHDSGFLRLEGGDPDRIGPYRILQRLGEGGMGLVYTAEQREPVRRKVAVKVLRGGYSSREVLARFDVERQALALMNHPNIARILDAGTTADHRPYIVMEFVPGEPVTRYCERRDLPLRERLGLFRTVCDAVQHAHQKGVIHRDLKPSNILVMEEDGQPVPKIIDFGIAKALTQRLTEHTLETKVGSLLGTPDYMSPEQAELSPLDVDTRSDVYALGAVLYQLLTGKPPLQLSGAGKSYSEMQRLILEQVPAPPSQRVGGALRRRLRGELDWVAMKALEKQRTLRYSSPAELATDVQRYLAGATVSAGPPSRWRKIDKFVRRHWLATASTLAIIVTLTVSQMMLVQKNRELQAERDRASTAAATSESVTAFLLDVFNASNPGNADAGKTTARELLDRARERIDNDTTISPDVRLRLLGGIGEAYGHVGMHERAIEVLGEARELAAAHGTPAQQLRILGKLGLSFELIRETAAARDVLEDALAAAAAGGITDLPRLFDVRRALAAVESETGTMERARDMLLSLLADARVAFGVGDERALDVGARLVYLHTQLAEYEQAEALTRELLPVARESLREDHPIVSYLRGNLAGVYMELERWRDAEVINRDIHATFLEQFGPEAQPTQNAMIGLAISTSDREEGLRLLRDVAAQQREQYGSDAPQLILTLQNMGWVMSRIPGREQEARALYDEALALAIRHRGNAHASLRSIHYGIAVLEARAGNTDAALSHLRDASAVRTMQYRAARDPDFGRLHDNPEFIALLGPFADVLDETRRQAGQ